MRTYPEITKEFLIHHYVEQFLSASQITKIVGCSSGLIGQKLRKYGIPRRSKADYVCDLSGTTIERWSVIQRVRNKNNEIAYECVCSCGTKQTVTQGHLARKESRMCKKCSYRGGSTHRCWKGCGALSGKRWCWIRSGAIDRGLPLTIAIEYAWDLFLKQNSRCALSDAEISFAAPSTASLDRIDSSQGYIYGNVQWLHRDVQKMKFDLDQNNFLGWCRKIADFQL